MQNIDLTADPEINATDFIVARNVAEHLHKHYPNNLWAVQCENNQIIIRNLMYSGQWGYRLFLHEAYSDSSLMTDVMRAGGEILERFNAERGKFNEDKYSDLKTNFAGQILFDKS